MNAKDIMSTPVVSVGPHTSVRDIAGLLFKHRISAVPVVDEGRLVGIVSEGDLLHRYEIGTADAGRGSWWRRILGPDDSVASYVKSHAARARYVMTEDLVTVSPDTSVARIAELLDKHRIKRVPVLQDGKLVGIVSRSDLVQALAAREWVEAEGLDDDAIYEQLSEELEQQPWWRSLMTNVVVSDGVVHYYGAFDSEAHKEAARVAAENVPGVRGVEDHRLPMATLSWSV
jgi:CBS-domain-containing membrane protein